MKILLLNTSDRIGGAAVAAHRLMQALLKQGIQADMLVRDLVREEEHVYTVNRSGWMRWLNCFRFYWERFIIFLFNHFSRSELFRVSIANVGNDISRNKLVQDADIIHLHWINQGFLSLKDIKALVDLRKPIVWTMHDMWPCTGICHHARECNKYQELCESCFYLKSQSFDLSTNVYRKKKFIYQNANITFVGCSDWLKQKALVSGLLKRKHVLNIPNAINASVFCQKEKVACRKELNLPLDKYLILFGALNVTDSRKGVDYLIRSLFLLRRKDIELVVFGQIKQEIKSMFPIPIHSMGYLSDEVKISILYNAVDLFVTSSLDENLPNTIMEAMACGTPCVGFRTGGIPEMIDHKRNGYVADYKDAEDLARGIRWVLDYPDKARLSEACVEKVQREYAEEVVVKRYIDLYNELVK